MLTCDTSDLLEQLKKFHKEATNKMQKMVVAFSGDIAKGVINRTPLGSAQDYPDEYAARLTDPSLASYGLRDKEGFARGSWRAGLNQDMSLDQEIQEIYGKNSGESALDLIVNFDLFTYKLGDTVVISNTGPYIKELDNNYSKQTDGEGIIAPTLRDITSIYQLQLDDYYRRAQ